jgi:heptosyltransferase II
MQIKKILIIQTAFIGDVILTTPMIRWAKTGLHDPDIHVLVIPTTKNVLENNPYIDNIILYDKRGKDKGLFGFIRLIWKLKKANYSLIISPHRSLRSALIARFAGAEKRIGFHNSSGALLFTDRVKYNPALHELDRDLSLLNFANLQITDRRPQVFPDNEDDRIAANIFRECNIQHQSGPVALSPGSVWSTKKWPEDYYKELVKLLVAQGIPALLTGGPEDKACCDRIMAGITGPVFNVAGKLTLRQSAAMYKKCAVLVCNDSGSMHLAVATGIPVIALFGPTIPGFGFYPFGDNHTIIEHPLACRPCGIHGGNKCPIGTHECMQAIPPSRVFQSVLKYIKLEA